jgi:23S rRNA C2498 (ribose-2'-O)-methylase RlmM
MKKRYQEVLLCQSRLQSLLEGAGCRYEVGFKHLYYDREEITGYIRKL